MLGKSLATVFRVVYLQSSQPHCLLCPLPSRHCVSPTSFSVSHTQPWASQQSVFSTSGSLCPHQPFCPFPGELLLFTYCLTFNSGLLCSPGRFFREPRLTRSPPPCLHQFRTAFLPRAHLTVLAILVHLSISLDWLRPQGLGHLWMETLLALAL